MDIIRRSVLRYRSRKEERKRQKETEIFKKPAGPYLPPFKNLAIIAAILFAIAITYMYLTSDTIIRNECAIMPGVECGNVYVTNETIIFDVSNFLKEDLNITIALEGCDEQVTHVIKPNKLAAYEFSCRTDRDRISKEIQVEYTGYSGLAHNKTGHITGKKE
jgi:hypothetical protein